MSTLHACVNMIDNKRYQPFIKWVGGKRGLLSQILQYFPDDFKSYHEPFLGGGAVFFELYSQGLLDGKEVYLSDVNAELINSYNIVKSHAVDLIDTLHQYKKEHSKEFYYNTRAQDREENFNNLSDVERAARFIYLNKTCFNGLYRVNKKGYFNTPMGSYKNPNIVDEKVILNASEALQNVTIENRCFSEVLKNAEKNDLVYFDPPYYPLTQTANFTSYDANCFLEDEQFLLYEIFERLSDNDVKVLQSNSDTQFINELYKNYDINIVNANRFINSKSSGRGKIKEVLMRSKKW